MHCWLSYSRSINSSWQQIADLFPSCLGVSRPCWCVVWEISGIFACVALHAEVLIVLTFFRKVLLGFWSFRWMAIIVSWPDIRERPSTCNCFCEIQGRGSKIFLFSLHFRVEIVDYYPRCKNKTLGTGTFEYNCRLKINVELSRYRSNKMSADSHLHQV